MSVLRSTLAAPAHFTQDVRKSRFLANASSIATPDAAIAFVAAVAHSDATHNCWAYRIGQQYRFNDDGEPAGTAGKPILQAIDGQGLDRVAVVVTRWFGGIKLGAGGLMRAYGGAAAECLRNASRCPLIETADVEFALGFVSLPLLHARLPDFDAHKLSETFVSDGAVLRVRMPTSRIEALRLLLADLSRGQCSMRVLD
jgi:uncharacterized YigZ family protein